MEGEHTTVLGVGEVAGKIAVAETPLDIISRPIFDEPGTIPVLLDEFAVTHEEGIFDGVSLRLRAGIWAGFVTFGSSEMIKTRRIRRSDPSHFMITLRDLVSKDGFIAVIEQDDRTDLSAMMLRSELGIFNGVDATLRAESPTKAQLEIVT